MKKLALTLIVLASAGIGYAVHAQTPPQRAYQNGTVWSIGFIHMEAGMEMAYLNYVAGEWKREQEALKKANIILSYRVIQTEDHGPDDWNLMLMTEYKDLATMEATELKADAVSLQLVGGEAKAEQGYVDRLKIRRIIGGRTGREIMLMPRATP